MPKNSFYFARIGLMFFTFLVLLMPATGKEPNADILLPNPQINDTSERKIFNIKHPRVPVSVTGVRNLQGTNWLRDLEIEVRNDSDKPIYLIVIALHFPDIPKRTGTDGVSRGTVIVLRFGRNDLIKSGQLATTVDVAISPGETHVFKIPESQAQDFENLLIRENFSESVTKRIALDILSVRFGDGTGFEGGGPYGTSQAVNNQNPEKKMG